MRQRRHPRPDGVDLAEVDLGEADPNPLPHVEQHLAPRIGDERMAVGLAAVLVPAALRGRDHEGAGLDGPRPMEHVPVRLPGLLGEGGRSREEGGPVLGQRLVQGGEAHVVADGHPEPAPGRLGQHRPLATRVGGRFAPALAVGQIDVVEVDLVVGGRDPAVAADEEGAVRDPVAIRHGDRAEMDQDAPLPGDLAQGEKRRIPLLRPDLVEQRRALALDEGRHLRCLHEIGALSGGLAHESHCGVPVPEGVASGAHLDAGGGEAGRGHEFWSPSGLQ